MNRRHERGRKDKERRGSKIKRRGGPPPALREGGAVRVPRFGVVRWISKRGAMSRVEALRAVERGRVSVNGRTVHDPEFPCVEGRDKICIDGREVKPARKVYLMMHKPFGCITTARDPEGRPTAYEYLPPGLGNVHAVGRLDATTTGLLLFTNDTDFGARVTQSGGMLKVYRVRLEGALDPHDGNRFAFGIMLDGEMTLPAQCKVIEEGDGYTVVEVGIREGRNRQIRRMWEALGYRILELHRLRIGYVELGDLPVGKTRPLADFEIEMLADGRSP